MVFEWGMNFNWAMAMANGERGKRRKGIASAQ